MRFHLLNKLGNAFPFRLQTAFENNLVFQPTAKVVLGFKIKSLAGFGHDFAKVEDR